MKRIPQKSISLLIILLLVVGLSVPALAAVPDEDLRSAVTASAENMLKTVKAPQVGSTGGEWAILGLARSGHEVPQEYWDAYYRTVEESVSACKGELDEKKYTEYSRVVVALTAIGGDPTNVGGYNLLLPLGDFDKTVWQGINGPVWALIALDAGNYDVPVNSTAKIQATRQLYVDEILSRQLDDGGWNLTTRGGAGRSDPDITGMALQALSKYQDQAEVKAATDRALNYLSGMQDTAGGYTSWGDSNSESVVQVLVALCELGIDLEDGRFVKNGNSLLDNLMSYRQIDGSFVHTSAGSGSSQMASEQGLYGIVAALRAAEGKSSLYRMEDVAIKISGNSETAIGLPGKHADVKKVAVSAPGTTFQDLSAHANQEAVEALASRGIISGRDDGRFDPNASMTRAEFATIVVKALGLSPKAGDAFSDVAADKWYAPYIGTAYTYGLIQGVGGGKFDPEGEITRQQAAVLVMRAAVLCGMDTEMQDHAIFNMLAQFADYISVADWAQQGVAFCYREGILDQKELNVEPNRAILRCEIAQMLYQLLGSAKLL